MSRAFQPSKTDFQSIHSCVCVCVFSTRRSTALGAALCAGSAVNLFGWDLERPETLAEVNKEGLMTFSPKLGASERERRARGWHKAVQRATDWNEVHQE